MSDDEKTIGATEDSGQDTGAQSSSVSGIQVEDSESQGSKDSGKPSRARVRIEQLARENRKYRESIQNMDSRISELEELLRVSHDNGDSFSDKSQEFSKQIDVRSHIDAKLEEEFLKRETDEARAFLRGQEGFDPDVDWEEMKRIAEENGWDELSVTKPMKAARLISDQWKKERGISAKSASKSQVAGVSGSAPRPPRTSSKEEVIQRAKQMLKSGEIPLHAKDSQNQIKKLFADWRKAQE